MKKNLFITLLIGFCLGQNVSESFEGDFFPPFKWDMLSLNTLNDVSRSSSSAYDGIYSARFCSKELVFLGMLQDQYMISPKLIVGVGENFSFWHDQSDWSGERFKVGISTTNNATDSFTFGPEVIRDDNSAGVWVQHVEDLSAYEGQEIYVAIKYTSIWKHYLYIDHVEGPAIVLDPEPDAYYSTDQLDFPGTYIQSSSSKDLIIGNGGGSDDLIGTLTSDNPNFEIGSFSGVIAAGSQEAVTITYTPNEVHSDGYADEGLITFTHNGIGGYDNIILRGQGTDNILSEGFEYDFPSTGWTIISNNVENGIEQSNSLAYGSNYSARFSSYYTASSGDYTQYLISPQVSIPTNGATYSMYYHTHWSFWDGLSNESFMIGISTTDNDPNNFIWYDEFVITSGGWNEHIEDLSTYAGQNLYVAIKYTSDYLYYLYIDDVFISPGGSGPQPIISLSHDEIPVIATSINSSSSTTFSISNSGVGELSGTITYPAGFSGPASFASNDAEIEVLFSPEASGIFGGWIEIQSNGGYESVYIEGSAGKSVATWEPSWPQGWTTMQNNGDGWQFFGPTGSRTGTGYAGAEWPNANTADWLISPKYSIELGSFFSFYASMGPSNQSVDIMKVYLSPTGGDQPDDFTVLIDSVNSAGYLYLPYSYDISDYAGTDVRLGILYTSEGEGAFTGWELNIDDVAGPEIVSEIGPEISEYPEEIDFGELIAGDSLNTLFDFYNIGDSDLEITNVYFNPVGVFSIDYTLFPHITAPNDSNGFHVIFNPTSDEDSIYVSEMTIVSNMGSDIVIPLTGIGRSSNMQIYDRMVLVEDFTAAEWCPFCPVGSFTVRDLIDDNPDEIISIQWHVGSSYFDENDCIKSNDSTCTSVRGDIYNVTAIPTEVFNGIDIVVGANIEWDNYARYDSVFQIYSGMKSDYGITINGTKNGSTVSYSVSVLNDNPFTNDDRDLHVFIVEDSISTTWNYQGVGDSIDYANNVVRIWNTDSMFTQQGALDYTYNGSFDFHDKPWDPNQIKIIAIIQNKVTKEIYQTSRIKANAFEFLNNANSGTLDGNQIPLSFSLHQNYPNPFNPVTSIRYDLPRNGKINITIYDMMGRRVKNLTNSFQTAGFKSVQWNATNDRNESVSAGLYLYTIQAGEFRQTKKMVLLK